jgi:DNA-directed RNA polymerase specialized sigma24 family protein
MNSEVLDNINRNLEVIVGLLIRSAQGADAATLRDRIVLLDGLGMRPKDIARVLGKSSTHISKELSLARAGHKEGGANK